MEKYLEDFLIELFGDLPKGAPGSKELIAKVYRLLKDLPLIPNMLDIGCGLGMQTFVLADVSKGFITALDIIEEFLKRIDLKAQKLGFQDRIKTIHKSMLEMDFRNEEFDLIWCESAVYNIGFERALIEWSKYLRSNGYLVISEAIWLKSNPPDEVRDFWNAEYPDIKLNEKNIEIIHNSGLKLVNSVNFEEKEWWDEYYIPLENKAKNLKKKYRNHQEFTEFLERIQIEVDIYRKFSDYYGYIYYVMQK